MKKSVLISGKYEMIKQMSVSLLNKKYRVTAICQDYDKCQELSELKGLDVYFGDATKPYVLQEAGIYGFDIAIAVTENDDANLVFCELCKKKFHIYKTICTINNSENTAFFRQMGVDGVVCATNAISGLIEQQAFVDEITTVIPVGDRKLSVSEVTISGQSNVCGKTLAEIQMPKDTIVGCVLRQENTIIPKGNTMILPGDLLVLLSGLKQAEDMQILFRR